ncbi:LysR family transcriptional regulator [Photobacterium ganghwense]|uniref:LysR family transcriptional regulator n=1 Tax=Photobacterium ganghwense TaxID=320778 RepID=UPI001C2D446C|nr:LysR family transcriptional regulator [Photobacterium ganghwense]MBV1839593.1 LysR family transcriptional regulator [Photobacterium ganghwense]
MHDLAALKAFDALCQYQSLTAAAEVLNQPKSTLSRRLAQLEVDLGQSLVTRQGNRLSLTEAGQVFSQYTRQILALSEQGKEALQSLSNDACGELTLLVHPNLLRGWFSKVLNQFMNAHPGIHINLHSQTLAAGNSEVDLMIWVGSPPEHSLRRELLGHWSFGLYASPAYLADHPPPTHPSELTVHPWIDLIAKRQDGLTLLHKEEGSYDLPPINSRLRTDSLTMQADAIANGRGIGMLPVWLADGFERAHPGSVLPCLPGWQPEATEVACYYTAGRPPLRVKVLLDALRQQCPPEWTQCHHAYSMKASEKSA